MNNTELKALSAAVLRILKPLVRILLRHGISYNTFADLAKWAYIDVATREFCLEGRKQTTSRVSILTGLTRKEVKKVRELKHPEDQASMERYNRAARVIAAWQREAEFLEPHGQPKALPMAGEGATFTELVRRFSGDVPARAIKDELLRVGAVEELPDGRLRLLARAYIPRRSEKDKIHILGTDVAFLISTIDHNLQTQVSEPFFQRKVAYDNLPQEVLPQFRRLAAQKGQKLLEKLDNWLAQHDRDTNPEIKGTGRNRAGLGIYYFEESCAEEENQS
ncbi:MAG: DUF6502 family protein [Thermodesulfobacteriota bacterium]